jgi:hypothetical protein
VVDAVGCYGISIRRDRLWGRGVDVLWQAHRRFDGPEVGSAELGVRGAGMTAGRSW